MPQGYEGKNGKLWCQNDRIYFWRRTAKLIIYPLVLYSLIEWTSNQGPTNPQCVRRRMCVVRECTPQTNVWSRSVENTIHRLEEIWSKLRIDLHTTLMWENPSLLTELLKPLPRTKRRIWGLRRRMFSERLKRWRNLCWIRTMKIESRSLSPSMNPGPATSLISGIAKSDFLYQSPATGVEC